MNWRENKGSKPSRSSSKGRPANPPAGPPKEPTDWRSKKSLLGGKESKKKGKAWVTKEIDPTSIRRATNLLRNGLILLVLTVSIVVFVIWMLQTRSRVQFVLVAPNDTSGGTWHSTKDYNDTMRAAFRKANEYNRNLDVIDSKTTNAFFDTKNSWTEAVAEIKLQLLGPNNDLSVFYFSGPTAVKGSGEKARPYFLPATADPLEDFGNWIDVEKLLGDIADTATTNGIGQKLVFIDALRVEPITSVGLSYDRFPRAVVAALNRLGKNNLHVIISHDNGQRNWVLPEVGMTAFGYMVQRGLMGEADGLLNANQEVSFGELVDYLRRAVFGFVKDARQSVQTPLVISPVFNAGKVDRDFGVVYIDRSGFSKWRSAEATESKSIDLLVSRVKQRSGDLLESWKEYKAKEQSGALNRFPLWSADAAALLIRMEQLLPAPESNEYEEMKSRLSQRLRQIQLDGSFVTGTSLTAGRLENSSNLPSAAEQAKLGEVWDKWIELRKKLAAAQNPDELRAAEDAIKDFRNGPINPLPPWHVLDLVWKGFLPASQTNPDNGYSFNVEDLRFWISVIQKKPVEPLQPVEGQLLEMLAAQVDWRLGDSNAGLGFRQALSCRDRAERIAYAIKKRPDGLQWIDADLHACEDLRRRGDDLLMASDFSGALTAYSQAQSEYQKLSDQFRQITNAIDVRDRASRNAPHLLIWAIRQRTIAHDRSAVMGETAAENDWDATLDQWERLMKDLSELDSVLAADRDSRNSANWGSTEDALSQKVENGLNELTGQFTRFAQSLEDRTPDVANLVDIESVLRNPLLDTKVREQLYSKYAETFSRQANKPAPLFKEFALSENASAEAETPYFQRIQGLQSAAISGLNDPTLKDLVFGCFSQSWNELLNEQQLANLVSGSQATSEDRDKLLASRDRLLRVDGSIRRISHTMAELPHAYNEITIGTPAREVSRDLYNLNRGLQICFEIDRALDDCWGDNVFYKSGAPLDDPNFAPYFARLSNSFYDQLNPREYKQSPDVQNRMQRRARMLKVLGEMSIKTADDLRYDPAVADTPHSMTVRLPLDPTNPDDFPKGIAVACDLTYGQDPELVTLDLRNNKEKRKIPVPVGDKGELSGPGETLDYFIPVQKYIKDPKTSSLVDFNAAFIFRGNARQVIFTAQPIPSADVSTPEVKTVRYEPQDLGSPRIQVFKEGLNRTDVMIILDCSASMSAIVDQGGEGGKARSRLEVLKGALLSLFDAMESANSFRVGLVALGHRTNYVGPGGEQKLAYSEVAQGSPDLASLRPEIDAEVLVHLPLSGSSSADDFDVLKSKVSRLKPWGQTPLYYAILKAIDEFPKNTSDQEIPRQIIVLSDGVNETYDLINGGQNLRSVDGSTKGDGIYYSQLMGEGRPTAKLKGIQVLYLGFNVKDDSTQPPKEPKNNLLGSYDTRLDQLETLAIKSGGRLFYPNTFENLKGYLDEIVNTESFEVQAKSGTLDSGPMKLGPTPWSPLPSEFKPGFYEVSLTRAGNRAEVYLEGGEQIVLEFGVDRTLKFLCPDLKPDHTAKAVTLGEGPTGGRYSIGQLLPDTHRKETALAFSFVNENVREFSYRPQRLALEVTPTSGQKAFPYFLQDYEYLTDWQEPVVEFSEIHLDPGQYNLRLWYLPFSEKPVVANQRVEVGGGATTTAKFGEHDVAIKRDGSLVEVTISGGDPDKLRTLLVDFLVDDGGNWQWIRSIKVDRRFNVDGQKVVHQFYANEQLTRGKFAIGLSQLQQVFPPGNQVQFDFSLGR